MFADDIGRQLVERQRCRIRAVNLLCGLGFELLDDRPNRQTFARARVLQGQAALATKIDLVLLENSRAPRTFRDQFTDRALFNRSTGCRIYISFMAHSLNQEFIVFNSVFRLRLNERIRYTDFAERFTKIAEVPKPFEALTNSLEPASDEPTKRPSTAIWQNMQAYVGMSSVDSWNLLTHD
jgi:hypothetical protein